MGSLEETRWYERAGAGEKEWVRAAERGRESKRFRGGRIWG